MIFCNLNNITHVRKQDVVPINSIYLARTVTLFICSISFLFDLYLISKVITEHYHVMYYHILKIRVNFSLHITRKSYLKSSNLMVTPKFKLHYEFLLFLNHQLIPVIKNRIRSICINTLTFPCVIKYDTFIFT
mgnify:CR=1 FL=1